MLIPGRNSNITAEEKNVAPVVLERAHFCTIRAPKILSAPACRARTLR
jgi:hypothetical protein